MSTYPVVVQLLKVPVSNPGFWTRFCAKEAVGITARAKQNGNSPRRKMRSARELCSLHATRSILETMTAPQPTPRRDLAICLRREAISDASAEPKLSAQLYE